MINAYYQEELQNLRELGAEYSRTHPALAPLLGGASADPDVERILEGVAFLTGLIRGKLDDDFPEIIHGLIDLVFPHYLRPIPSAAIVAFSPKPSLQESLWVKAGTSLGANPVEGTECRYRTCLDTEVHPLSLKSTELLRTPGSPDQIRLQLELSKLDLPRWKPRELTFYLGGESFGESADLYQLLTRSLKQIRVRNPSGGSEWVLPPEALIPLGLDLKQGLLPFPSQTFRGYRLLQDFFLLPQKFLFLAMRNWENWQDRGTGTEFEIIFDLRPSSLVVPKPKLEHFTLHATPAVNLFSYEADPVILSHRQEKVRVRPSGQKPDHYQIFSVDQVAGFAQGSVARRDYRPLSFFASGLEDRPTYQVCQSLSPLDGRPEVALQIAYSANSKPMTETLSIQLTCTNGKLPERLQLGDICRQTEDSPELLNFRNITPPTSPAEPQLGRNTLWKLLSHLGLNYLSLANPDSLKELLRLYVFPGRDQGAASAHLKRVDGIVDFQAQATDRLHRGQVHRGQTLLLALHQDFFASLGDLLLFASVLDIFLGAYASLNTFTSLSLREVKSGEIYSWPARLGDRYLL